MTTGGREKRLEDFFARENEGNQVEDRSEEKREEREERVGEEEGKEEEKESDTLVFDGQTGKSSTINSGPPRILAEVWGTVVRIVLKSKVWHLAISAAMVVSNSAREELFCQSPLP